MYIYICMDIYICMYIKHVLVYIYIYIFIYLNKQLDKYIYIYIYIYNIMNWWLVSPTQVVINYIHTFTVRLDLISQCTH